MNLNNRRSIGSSFINRVSAFSLLAFLSLAIPASGQQTWTKADSVTADSLRGATFGGGTFVCVGDNGTVLTSTNGSAWTIRTSGTTQALRGAAFGGSTFVAVGAGGTILSSSDGASWTARTSTTTKTLLAAAYGNGMFVAVGDTGTILTSTDGATWTKQTSVTDTTFTAATYGNGMFVLVGGVTTDNDAFQGGQFGTIVTSVNGVTWQKRTYAMIDLLRGVAWTGTKFVVIGNEESGSGDPGDYLTSTDGVDWGLPIYGFPHPLTAPSLSAQWYYGLIAVGNQLVAVGSNGAIVSAADTTTDTVITWTNRTPAIRNGIDLHAIAYGNGMFVAAGCAGLIYTSPNTSPVKWTGQSLSMREAGMTVVGNTVRYSVELASDVSIRLFDAKGRLVRTVVDLRQEPGRYSHLLPTNLSAGKYVLSMTAGSRTFDRPVMIVK